MSACPTLGHSGMVVGGFVPIRPGFFVLSNKVSGTGGLMPNA